MLGNPYDVHNRMQYGVGHRDGKTIPWHRPFDSVLGPGKYQAFIEQWEEFMVHAKRERFSNFSTQQTPPITRMARTTYSSMVGPRVMAPGLCLLILRISFKKGKTGFTR